MKSLGPDYLPVYLAKLKTEVPHFFINTVIKMKEERQFNKGSHKLKPLQPQEYLHLSRWSIIFQLIPQKSTSEGRVNRRAAAKGMSTTRTRHHELL